jgi:hypothetical protein
LKDSSQSLFRSGAASPAELLGRVRRRLGSESTIPHFPADPRMDLARGEGLLEGWYDAETHDGSPVRWVARRFAFEAEVREATHVLLEAAVFPESGLSELRLRIRANDVLGAAVRLHPGWNSRLLPIPAGVSGRVHFSVDAGGSWSPVGDPRELAILVRQLALVRFVELPRVGGDLLGQADPRVARPPALSVRIARKARRLLLGWELSDRLLAVEETRRRLGALEDRFDSIAGVVEDRLCELARADAEASADAAEREEEWQEEVARKFLEFYRG